MNVGCHQRLLILLSRTLQAFSNALVGAKDGDGHSATEDPKPPPNTYLDRYGFMFPVTPTEKGPKPLPKSEEEVEQRCAFVLLNVLATALLRSFA